MAVYEGGTTGKCACTDQGASACKSGGMAVPWCGCQRPKDGISSDTEVIPTCFVVGGKKGCPSADGTQAASRPCSLAAAQGGGQQVMVSAAIAGGTVALCCVVVLPLVFYILLKRSKSRGGTLRIERASRTNLTSSSTEMNELPNSMNAAMAEKMQKENALFKKLFAISKDAIPDEVRLALPDDERVLVEEAEEEMRQRASAGSASAAPAHV